MRLTEAESLLKESSRILSSESPRSEFGQLMTAAEESMGQLATYIASIRNMWTLDNNKELEKELSRPH